MSINIILQPEKSITIDEVEVLAVRDLFQEKTIIARIKDLPRPVVLWKGEEEYAAAGDWTNETAIAKAIEVLSAPEINWA